jgi:hypothetical protein
MNNLIKHFPKSEEEENCDTLEETVQRVSSIRNRHNGFGPSSMHTWPAESKPVPGRIQLYTLEQGHTDTLFTVMCILAAKTMGRRSF